MRWAGIVFISLVSLSQLSFAEHSEDTSDSGNYSYRNGPHASHPLALDSDMNTAVGNSTDPLPNFNQDPPTFALGLNNDDSANLASPGFNSDSFGGQGPQNSMPPGNSFQNNFPQGNSFQNQTPPNSFQNGSQYQRPNFPQWGGGGANSPLRSPNPFQYSSYSNPFQRGMNNNPYLMQGYGMPWQNNSIQWGYPWQNNGMQSGYGYPWQNNGMQSGYGYPWQNYGMSPSIYNGGMNQMFGGIPQSNYMMPMQSYYGSGMPQQGYSSSPIQINGLSQNYGQSSPIQIPGL